MLFGKTSDQFLIQDLSAREFASRLEGHVDLDRPGFSLGNKNEFYGTVYKNTFKLNVSKMLKSEELSIYGEFSEQDKNLLVTLEYTMNQQKQLVFAVMCMAGVFLLTYSIFQGASMGTIYFFIFFTVLALLMTYVSSNSEQQNVYSTLKKIFRDKTFVQVNVK